MRAISATVAVSRSVSRSAASTHDEFKLFADRDYAYTDRLRPLADAGEATAATRHPTATA